MRRRLKSAGLWLLVLALAAGSMALPWMVCQGYDRELFAQPQPREEQGAQDVPVLYRGGDNLLFPFLEDSVRHELDGGHIPLSVEFLCLRSPGSPGYSGIKPGHQTRLRDSQWDTGHIRICEHNSLWSGVRLSCPAFRMEFCVPRVGHCRNRRVLCHSSHVAGRC